MLKTIPREPGSYILWLQLSESRELTVGNLGQFSFPAGEYVYLGSAHGPGGLRARLERHLRGGGQPHWHIDRLRAVTEVRGYAYQTKTMYNHNPPRLNTAECDWSQSLYAQPEAVIPASGFGASDCRTRCAAHLVHFPSDIQSMLARFARKIGIPFRVI